VKSRNGEIIISQRKNDSSKLSKSNKIDEEKPARVTKSISVGTRKMTHISPRTLPSRRKKQTVVLPEVEHAQKKIRIKCTWEHDKRFVWVQPSVSVEDLLFSIQEEYNTPISVGQIKFRDPHAEHDLMTISKPEDLQMCFEKDPVEIFIITSATSPRPRQENESGEILHTSSDDTRPRIATHPSIHKINLWPSMTSSEPKDNLSQNPALPSPKRSPKRKTKKKKSG